MDELLAVRMRLSAPVIYEVNISQPEPSPSERRAMTNKQRAFVNSRRALGIQAAGPGARVGHALVAAGTQVVRLSFFSCVSSEAKCSQAS
jgi:hypothetical protein